MSSPSAMPRSLSYSVSKSQSSLNLGVGAAPGHDRLASRDSRMARFWYKVEQVISTYGRSAQIVMLLFALCLQVFVYGIIYSLVWRYEEEDPRPPERVSRYFEGWWQAWTFMCDGGTHAKTFHAEQRLIGGAISCAGIIFLAIVIAFIVDIVREKMDSMRVGKSQVQEKDHFVILFWSDIIIPLIKELCIAYEMSGGTVVVILAKEQMDFMHTELATQLPGPARRGTKIVCRYGNPILVSDLIKVAADRAKTVLILAGARSSNESDSTTLRTILSLKSLGNGIAGHMVAEVRDIDNEPLLKLVGGGIVETVVSHDVLGRLMLMGVRQMGLANVYEAMLGFEGNEFYIKYWEELVGIKFGELIGRFPDAIPIGIKSQSGRFLLNPGPEYEMQEGDNLIVIAEDEHSYRPMEPISIDPGFCPEERLQEAGPENILICGWRRDIRDVFKLLDLTLQVSSEVHTMTHNVPPAKRNAQLLEEGLDVRTLTNIKLVHHPGNTSVRRRLEKLPIETYSSCIIFADQEFEDDSMLADSHSLATLVLIRDIQSSREMKRKCPVSCEVLDSRTQQTISGQKELNELSNFVQSNRLVAKMLAMIGESRTVKTILDELLGATGNNLLIIPATTYVAKDEVCSFFVVANRVANRDAILIGYQEIGSGETTLNPCDKDRNMKWTSYCLAVIAGESNMERLLLHRSGSTKSEGDTKARPPSDDPTFPWKEGAGAGTGTGRRFSYEGFSEELGRDALWQSEVRLSQPPNGSLPDVPEEGHYMNTGMAAVDEAINRQCTMMTPAELSNFGLQLQMMGKSICEGTHRAGASVLPVGVSAARNVSAELKDAA